MPIWLTLVIDIIKALLTGELQAWLKERKESEARNDAAKVDSLSSDQLNKQFDSDLVRK